MSMDKLAQRLTEWFGSSPFILFHAAWFVGWVGLHILLNFDPDWSALTVIVSLEAIFLSLFILRAENVEIDRDARNVRRDLRTRRDLLEEIENLKNSQK